MEKRRFYKKTTLTETWYEVFNREIELQRVSGLEDIASDKLLNGEDGGGIRVYKGDKNVEVTLVDFELGEGVPVPHHDNRLCVGVEIFQISPDLIYKVPA